jgi:hypothetical protein
VRPDRDFLLGFFVKFANGKMGEACLLKQRGAVLFFFFFFFFACGNNRYGVFIIVYVSRNFIEVVNMYLGVDVSRAHFLIWIYRGEN